MNGRLEGKKAFITAAGQGIGRATAIAFASEGAMVVASDVNDEALESLAGEYKGIERLHLNVTDGNAIIAAARSNADTDVLFNCAGWVHNGTVLDCDEAAWTRSFEINVTGMYRTIRAFLPGMLERGHGNIINMSSVASSIRGVPNRFAYGATKAAVIGITKAIAADYISRGIRCNAVCPGTVETPSLEGRMRALGDYEQAREAFIARQPMGRLGRPEEIAALCVYLAGDESGYTTGQAHVIDGGWNI